MIDWEAEARNALSLAVELATIQAGAALAAGEPEPFWPLRDRWHVPLLAQDLAMAKLAPGLLTGDDIEHDQLADDIAQAVWAVVGTEVDA